MRETCARVLAAALITGAIATVVGMSALFDTPRNVERDVTAPPSALAHSIRVTMRPALRNTTERPQRRAAHSVMQPSVARAVVSREIVRRKPTHRRAPRQRELAAVKPKPAAPPVEPAPPPAETPAPVVAPVESAPVPDAHPGKAHEHHPDPQPEHGQDTHDD
jgi:hypothetical protein